MKPDVVFPLEQAGWPALLVDSTSTICRANATALRLFGSPLEGAMPKLSAIWSPENGGTSEQFLARWESAPAAVVPLKFRGKGGAILSFDTSICSFVQGQKYFVFQLLSAQVHADAASKSSNAEANLAHKHKLDCALQLARTVALDFNNALTSILGHTSLLLTQMELNHRWRASLLEVEKSAARAAEIANDLGAFSQQDKETRSHIAGSLNLLLQRSVEFFQKTFQPEPGIWSMQLERRLFTAKFDEAKMQQAVLKILENALEALPAKEGRITMQTRNVELSQPLQDGNVRLLPGAYVCLEVSDNGSGIQADVLPRIFEPFFTTKKGARHRGLGLAWVYGIVTNHGGSVVVSSQPGVGTSVRLYIPAEKRIVRDGGVNIDNLRGNQRILVVDDEDLVLSMSQTILTAYGYEVSTANSGQKALELLSQQTRAVDLVITDLVMPAMSGRELVEHIRKVSPRTRVLCTSGYVWPASQETDPAYLSKPFTSQELLVRVKQSLSTEL